MGQPGTESELKIPVDDLAPLKARLQQLGARPDGAPALEHNVLLDTPEGSLRHRGEVLRLRRWDGRAIVTFKGPATYSGTVKERLELETHVSDLDTLADILERLGLTGWMRYEKRRQTWRLDAVEVALDETPLGAFVELEGPADELAAAAAALGLDPDHAVRSSYVGLWMAHRERHPDAPHDMVFEP